MREINKIIIHCSVSYFGTRGIIEKWHKERGFNEIGYHFVIGSGRPTAKSDYNELLDGQIEVGRDIKKIGAHCRGHNSKSIGICLIGENDFTLKQFFFLIKLCESLCEKYHIDYDNILPHNKFNKHKTCPNFDISFVKSILTQSK